MAFTLQPGEGIFCRLCGSQCHNMCINLERDDFRRDDILKKLGHLRAGSDWTDSWLPKTVCFTCERKLNDAYEFVLLIEKTRNFLKVVLHKSATEPVKCCPAEVFVEATDLDLQQTENDLGEVKVEVKQETLNEDSSDHFDNNMELIEHYIGADHAAKASADNEAQLETFAKYVCDSPDDNSGKKYKRNIQKQKKLNITVECERDNYTNNYKNIVIEVTGKAENAEDFDENIEYPNECINTDDDYEEPKSLFTVKNTWEDYSWSCVFCVNQFPTFKEFKKHSIQQHNWCNTYQCTYCDRQKFVMKKFIKHVGGHREYLLKCCYICLKKFKTKRDMFRHMSSHNGKLSCEGCETSFKTLEDKKAHEKVLYMKVSNMVPPLVKRLSDHLTCLKCRKKFDKKYSLTEHILKDHNDDGFVGICDRCGRTFTRLNGLLQHLKCHESLTRYECEICHSTFKTLILLRRHVLCIHEGKKSFICNECGKGFCLKEKLVSHMIIHSDRLAFVCKVCEKPFRRKEALKLHMNQHTGEMSYSCSNCDKHFMHWSNYNKHMLRIHNMDMRVPKRMEMRNMANGMGPDTNNEQIIKWKEEVFRKLRPVGRTKCRKKIK